MGTSGALFIIAVGVLSSSAQVTTSGELPHEAVGTVHFYEGRAIGSCRRDDVDLSAVAFCGEAYVGFDLRFASRWTLNTELGVGFFPSRHSGDSGYGIERRSGGPLYLAMRWGVGYDFTERFFMRAGPQVRVAFAFNRPVPGVQLAFDHGTRFGRLELGVRTFFGVDGVASTGGAADAPHWKAAFALGVLAFVRVRLA